MLHRTSRWLWGGFGVALIWLWVASTGSKSRSWNHERPETSEIADILHNRDTHRPGEQCSSRNSFVFRVFSVFRGLPGCSCVQGMALMGMGAGFDGWTRCYPIHYLIDSVIT
jgi:hypothetical protein